MRRRRLSPAWRIWAGALILLSLLLAAAAWAGTLPPGEGTVICVGHDADGHYVAIQAPDEDCIYTWRVDADFCRRCTVGDYITWHGSIDYARYRSTDKEGDTP